MTKRRGTTNTTEHRSERLPKDFTIHPHRDHVTSDAIPFKLDDYGDSGALSEQQIRTISTDHGLSTAQAAELSQLVGYSLDVDTQISFVTISRATVESRLHDRKLAKRNRDKQLDASQANALFKGFDFRVAVANESPSAETASEPPHMLNSQMDGTVEVSLDEAQRILQPNDRRKERDNRRLFVVESCCYVALDAGWSLTYTTDSTVMKNQRGGRLINLIKDVIAMVSKNGQIASVHTLKTDIELVRRRFEMRGDLPKDARPK